MEQKMQDPEFLGDTELLLRPDADKFDPECAFQNGNYSASSAWQRPLKFPLCVKSENPFALNILYHVHLREPFLAKSFVAGDG